MKKKGGRRDWDQPRPPPGDSFGNARLRHKRMHKKGYAFATLRASNPKIN